MNMQKGNQLANRNILLKRKKRGCNVDFLQALNSIDDSNYNFINYLSSCNSKRYLLAKKYYEESLCGDDSFLIRDFGETNYTNGNEFKNEKIKSLIKQTSNKELSDIELTELLKYKCKSEKDFQLFIKYESELDKGIVYLIDLYHMVIPTDKYGKGYIKKSNPEKDYERIKNKVGHKANLSDIKR